MLVATRSSCAPTWSSDLLLAVCVLPVAAGDWDSRVPYTDAEAWTEGMGYPVASPWHPWMYDLNFEGEVSSQVGGYATRYAKNNFTFVTVRGGRHEVPETAPDKAFAMIKGLLSGWTFDSSPDQH